MVHDATAMNPPEVAVSGRARLARAGAPRGERRHMSDLARRLRELSAATWGEAKAFDMVGTDPSFLELQSKLLKIAPFQEPVLIIGESGSGKEHLAQAIYLLSDRKGKPFVSVSCPQYQEGNLTVSELFGHVRGSFTGAATDRKGCFETADGGVIFLDEIADLHMSAQVMLLRALATGEFRPLGSDRQRSVSVRLVAATNKTVDELQKGAAFRPDLLFRLKYFLLEVPPLRKRGDDWYLLLEYFLEGLHRRYGVAKHFSSASLKLLEDYDWPGNVRQLVSVATTGYAMSDGDTVEPKDLISHLEASERPHEADAEVESLHQGLVAGQADFWTAVHEPFLERDLNRPQVKALLRRGLLEANGNYRRLLDTWQIPEGHYQKFMDFLRHNRLKP